MRRSTLSEAEFATLVNTWANTAHRAPYGMFETLVVRLPVLDDAELVFGPHYPIQDSAPAWRFEYARPKAPTQK